MDLSTVLAADLAALTAVLGAPGTDLGKLLDGLSLSLGRAVLSCVGLSMTVEMDGCPVTLRTVPVDAGAGVASSMRMPLAALAPVGHGGFVTFYATNAGAFVDLAADLDFTLGGSSVVVLDDDLAATALPPGVAGLDDLSMVNRAIGHLIDGGRTPTEAMVELDRRAGQAGVSRSAAAQVVVTDPGRP